MHWWSVESKADPWDARPVDMESVLKEERHQISISIAPAQHAQRTFVPDGVKDHFQFPEASYCVPLTESDTTKDREKGRDEEPSAGEEREGHARPAWDIVRNNPSKCRNKRSATLRSTLSARPAVHHDRSEAQQTSLPYRTKAQTERVNEDDVHLTAPCVRVDQAKTRTLFLLTQSGVQFDQKQSQNVPFTIVAGHNEKPNIRNDATHRHLEIQLDLVSAAHVQKGPPNIESEATISQSESKYNRSDIDGDEQPHPMKVEDGLLPPLQILGHTSATEAMVPSDHALPELKVQNDNQTCQWRGPSVDLGNIGHRSSQRIASANALQAQALTGHVVGEPQCVRYSYAEDFVSSVWCREDSSKPACSLCFKPVHPGARTSVNPSFCHLRHRSCLHHRLKHCVLRHHSLCSRPGCSARDVLVKLLLFLLLASPAFAVEFSVQVVVVERCDSEFSETSVTQALSNATDLLTQDGVAPSVKFVFSQRRYCQQRDALEKAAEIFNGSEHLVIGVAPYELQSTLTKLAQLYQKPYVSANFYTPREVSNDLAFSLLPSYGQAADVLGKLLMRLQWQEVLVVATDDSYWQALATEVHVQLAGAGFAFRDMITLPVGVSAAEAEEALKGVRSSSKGKPAVFVCPFAGLCARLFFSLLCTACLLACLPTRLPLPLPPPPSTRFSPQWDTANAEIEDIPSAENPELKGSPFKPAVGQHIAMYALSAVRDFFL